MKAGPIILLIWFLLLAASLATAVVTAVVKGASSLRWSALTVLGAFLCYGFISAWLGVSEGVWTTASPGLLVALAAGGAGVVSTIAGIWGLARGRSADGGDKEEP